MVCRPNNIGRIAYALTSFLPSFLPLDILLIEYAMYSTSMTKGDIRCFFFRKIGRGGVSEGLARPVWSTVDIGVPGWMDEGNFSLLVRPRTCVCTSRCRHLGKKVWTLGSVSLVTYCARLPSIRYDPLFSGGWGTSKVIR